MGRTGGKIKTIKNRILNPPFAAFSKWTSKFNLYRNCQTSSAADENSPGSLHPHKPALATQKDTLQHCQVSKALKNVLNFCVPVGHKMIQTKDQQREKWHTCPANKHFLHHSVLYCVIKKLISIVPSQWVFKHSEIFLKQWKYGMWLFLQIWESVQVLKWWTTQKKKDLKST